MQIKRQDKFDRKIRKVRVVSFKFRTSLRWFDILWDVIFVAGNPSFFVSLFVALSLSFCWVCLSPVSLCYILSPAFLSSKETQSSSKAALFISSWFCSLKTVCYFSVSSNEWYNKHVIIYLLLRHHNPCFSMSFFFSVEQNVCFFSCQRRCALSFCHLVLGLILSSLKG